jgi:hypothetical protein
LGGVDPDFRQLVSRPVGGTTSTIGGQRTDQTAFVDPAAADVLRLAPHRYIDQDAYPRATEHWSASANLVPVGAFSRPFGGFSRLERVDRFLAPSFWPHPRDEDIAAGWRAIQDAWQNLTARKSRGRGVVRSPPLQPTGRESQEIYEPTDQTLSDYPKCNQQYMKDVEECNSREGDENSRWRSACFAHAMKRRLACEANDGTPDLMVPPFRWPD